MQYKKMFISLIIPAFIAASNFLAAGAQGTVTTVTVLTDVQQVKAGQDFTARVEVAHAIKIYGVSFKLSYDPQLFEVVKSGEAAVNPGSFFGNKPGFTLKNAVDAATGSIEYALTLTLPAEPVSGDGILGLVTFHALKDAPVSITAIQANLVSPEFSEVNGHLIAQRVDQVPAQIIQSGASGQSSVTGIFSNPALNTQPTVKEMNQLNVTVSRVPLIVAGLFFVAGLVLLTLSVGMYSRMRVRSNRMVMKEIQPEQVF
jgi:cohesin domain-containing protein